MSEGVNCKSKLVKMLNTHHNQLQMNLGIIDQDGYLIDSFFQIL